MQSLYVFFNPKHVVKRLAKTSASCRFYDQWSLRMSVPSPIAMLRTNGCFDGSEAVDAACDLVAHNDILAHRRAPQR